MARLSVNLEIAKGMAYSELTRVAKLCPFQAIEISNGSLEVNSGCKMCKICLKKGPPGLFEIIESEAASFVDKASYKGVAVYIDHAEGDVHPVSLELLGKARELADKIGDPVYALLIGRNLSACALELLHYQADEVFIYDRKEFENFMVEPYAAALADFVRKIKPSSMLIGATVSGRSLAPRAAAKLKTGLTADCTKLDIKENSDLVQIRPAFGGNIMAQIVTPRHRPQMATVRYKIFSAPARKDDPSGKVTECFIDDSLLFSGVKIEQIRRKERKPSISDAEVIVACGRGFKAQKDLKLAYQLADLLGAEIACTRPLIEAGWIDASRQIGLSGRTVKPKLIISLGISGSVQFKAGMENSETIVSVNSDESAPIFQVSRYAAVGDLYEILPKLIRRLNENKKPGFQLQPASFTI
ncbi:MAG: electron transfer flavoprotein subunit alpha/FixB family protein [Clostridiales bacterium]|jgi:electron transfer flavoprotein alpha subunit|nr:electron transfer flavoprotein subunit alpha/FixB family protein [Clostridiales bacterium]